jgi:serine protease Do
VIRSFERGPSSPFFSDPFFRQFFGDEFGPWFRVPRERREHSLGSGALVNSDGYLLTNNHVVQGAEEIKVSLYDKREMKAKVIGADPKTDIAVLKLEAKDLPVIVLGRSSNVEVGDIALALGNPFGIGQTVTMGIVSATGRGGLGIEDYEDFIQTDAAINPGNSGGALINVRGELIGINTAIISGSGGNQGVGFAVPVDLANQVMQQILQHGKVVRGWLGVVVQPVNPSIAKAFDLKESRGALIGDLTPDSPAARAGLQKGDIILELDGKPVVDSRDLSLKIGMMAPGSEVKLKVFRNGAERELTAKLGEMPAKMGRSFGEPGSTGGFLEGLSVDELTSDAAR